MSPECAALYRALAHARAALRELAVADIGGAQRARAAGLVEAIEARLACPVATKEDGGVWVATCLGVAGVREERRFQHEAEAAARDAGLALLAMGVP